MLTQKEMYQMLEDRVEQLIEEIGIHTDIANMTDDPITEHKCYERCAECGQEIARILNAIRDMKARR